MILGDDIIIANPLVAKTYIKVCEDFGIRIGLEKSFVSENGFGNFAGQSFIGPVNLSPISINEEVVINTPFARAEMALRMLRREFWSLLDPGWFTKLLRFMLGPTAYNAVVANRAKKVVDPLVPSTLMAVFGDPRKMQSIATSPVTSIITWIGSITSSNRMFSMPFEAAWNTLALQAPWVKECLLSISLLKARLIFKKFSTLDGRLQELSTILEQHGSSRYAPCELFPANKQYLRFVVLPYETLERNLERFRSWERKYVALLERVLLTAGSFPMDSVRAEYEFGVPLERVYEDLCTAEQELPLAIDAPLGEEVPDRELDPDQGWKSFDTLLDHLGHLIEIANMPESIIDPGYWEEILAQEGLNLSKKY
jgi:hypothetical protein